jgi:hypothetical protein
MKEDEDLGLYIEQMEKEESEQETLEEAKNNAWDNYEYVEGNLYSTSFKNGFELGVKWSQEQNKKMYIALETAISLLKQTTEYEVLDSWKDKVKELEQFKKEKDL